MAETTATAPATAPAAPKGWQPVFGFLDGLGGAAQRLGGIVDTVADGAEDVARGRSAIHEEQDANAARDLDLALRLKGFERGDNRLVIFAVAAGAVALIMLMR